MQYANKSEDYMTPTKYYTDWKSQYALDQSCSPSACHNATQNFGTIHLQRMLENSSDSLTFTVHDINKAKCSSIDVKRFLLISYLIRGYTPHRLMLTSVNVMMIQMTIIKYANLAELLFTSTLRHNASRAWPSMLPKNNQKAMSYFHPVQLCSTYFMLRSTVVRSRWSQI